MADTHIHVGQKVIYSASQTNGDADPKSKVEPAVQAPRIGQKVLYYASQTNGDADPVPFVALIRKVHTESCVDLAVRTDGVRGMVEAPAEYSIQECRAGVALRSSILRGTGPQQWDPDTTVGFHAPQIIQDEYDAELQRYV